ncbi:ABC transporter substrate-binding protein [Ammoniphilus resinae]|uniref:Multiple sugar transport system substrate-binding protein n=1 Tax=Ammoniphilus resinae TaxID=861532 RepID=A0ABS4GW11_9BACL|nr:extracellular solute-binding protein [Ammoniphilus resinae]MBP1934458.1 multiple sugar transport system substrate-binding protein [Ammoniphilus resinae]
MGVVLKGITWNHSRGFIPVVATAQRFAETHPGVEIHWEKRSLQEFADYPIGKLAESYDLLVIDHPWAGFAASHDVLVPFNQYLPEEFMQDQAENSVGKSHESYISNGNQYALAIDAATPVASYRKDLFERDGMEVPETWEDLISLAKQGKVALPAIPVDTVMNYYMLCVSQGEEPFLGDHFISEEMGIRVLEQLRELTNLCTPEVYQWNPIKVYEALSTRDDLYYCPFAFSYSNYSRPGYAQHPLTFTDMVKIGEHGRLRSTLGGTGLAISSKTKNLETALAYAQYTASPECQRTVYVENGGQPGHRSAWVNERVNENTRQFFSGTLAAHDRAYLRPRYNGYLHFQDNAGDIMQSYVRNGGNPRQVLEKLQELYQESKVNR